MLKTQLFWVFDKWFGKRLGGINVVEEIFQTGKSTVYIVFTQSNEVELNNEALNKKILETTKENYFSKFLAQKGNQKKIVAMMRSYVKCMG